MTMRRVVFVVSLAIAAALVGTPLAGAQQSEGSISIGLVDFPTNRADDPRAALYIVDHVAPGETVSRRVAVTNSTNKSQTIDTYAAAASIKDGQFHFGEGHAVNELTTWTTVAPPSDAYAPGDKKLVQVTITVPKDASPGERYAVIWASVASAPSSGNGISAVNRVGVRVYLSVGPGGEPPSNFAVTGIRARRTKTGEPQVVATVKNTGGRALDLSGKLNLDGGPGGLSAGPFQVKLGTTLGVGDTEPVVTTLDKALPAGPWKAHLSLESGLTKRSATATITFPKSGNSANIKPASSTNRVVLSVAILLLVAGVGFFFVYSRRRRVGH